ncbi:transposase [Planomonospora alba]|uniref:transposase n=1 Tax=Planomonospora alba TaxID=161354 RepID=UPI003CD0A7CA
MTRRFDLTDAQWAVLEPLLPAPKRSGRPPSFSKRQLIGGIRWRVRTGRGLQAASCRAPPSAGWLRARSLRRAVWECWAGYRGVMPPRTLADGQEAPRTGPVPSTRSGAADTSPRSMWSAW